MEHRGIGTFAPILFLIYAFFRAKYKNCVKFVVKYGKHVL
jgi:hypothetical protein